MGERADACRRRANDCELAASRVKDPGIAPSETDKIFFRPAGAQGTRLNQSSKADPAQVAAGRI